MEPLWKLLGVTQGLTAVIGSGGKTSLLYELAEELRPCGTVLLATTTHIMKPPQYPFAETAEQLSAALAAEGVACAGSFTPEGKLTAPDFDGWQQAADFVLVEADGSKRLPAKAHETWEPVLPPQRTRTICVVGASAFGQPIRQAAHRPAVFARLAGVGWGSVITPEMVARVIAAEGLCDVIYVNQVDAPETALPWAASFVKAAGVPVAAGSLQTRHWEKQSTERYLKCRCRFPCIGRTGLYTASAVVTFFLIENDFSVHGADCIHAAGLLTDPTVDAGCFLPFHTGYNRHGCTLLSCRP